MKQLCEIKKNSREVIRVVENEFKGKELVDIRTYYYDENADEIKPTKKGISFSKEVLPEILEALRSIEVEDVQ